MNDSNVVPAAGGSEAAATAAGGKAAATAGGGGGLMSDLQHFASETTFHGVKNASAADIPTPRRLTWLVLLLAITAFSVAMITLSVNKYLQYDTVTSIREKQVASLDFPTLEFCNFNMINQRAVAALYPHVAQFESFYNALLNGANVTAAEAAAQFGAMTPLLQAVTLHEYYTAVGYTADEMFVMCTRGSLSDTFNCSDYIQPTLKHIGVCQTFHSADVIRSLGSSIKVSQPSSEDGVSFVLDVAPRDYSGITAGSGYGFYVSIYNPRQAWADDNSRITLALGTHSFVAIEKRVKKILPRPYNDDDCRDVAEDDDDYETHRACMLRCRNKLWFSSGVDAVTGAACSCDPSATSGHSQCTLFDLYFCLYPYLVSYSSSVLPRVCDCPYACSESTYDYSISSTELANEYVVTQAQINDWQYQNKTSIQQNYVSVQIFFRSLTETIVAEIPEVTLVDMFGSIGGQLGLCVGASLITFAEFLEFTGVTLVKFCRRRRQRHADVIKVKPASDVIVQDA